MHTYGLPGNSDLVADTQEGKKLREGPNQTAVQTSLSIFHWLGARFAFNAGCISHSGHHSPEGRSQAMGSRAEWLLSVACLLNINNT